MLLKTKFHFALLILLGFSVGCRKQTLSSADGFTIADSLVYNPDWTFASHGNSEPNYNSVFPQNSVNRLEIIVGSEGWNSIKANMKSLYGSDFGMGGQQPPGASSSMEPSYVNATIKFNGKTWKNVGYRLKGNSTLRSAWSQGNYKLPFRLNFDEFEDAHPATHNQHFFGFEDLSFSPGFSDPSLIHEKAASDIFRMAGIPSCQTAFYAVYTDLGSGLKYTGLYTAVELPDDHMIKSQFGEESGNIYKPESNFTSFSIPGFEKKNNETAADYSDVQAFVYALNSPLRTTNAAQWRANLEAVFNMDHFIKYQAVNNAMVNWDSYGIMAHNLYLYHHSTQKLLWIPWDHNEALTGSPGITGSGPGMKLGLSLSMNEVSSNWPLIRYMADDPIYMQQYKTYLKQFKDNVFTEASMNSLFDKYNSLVSPYAIGSNGEVAGSTYLTSSAAFTASLATLKAHVVARRLLISTYVP